MRGETVVAIEIREAAHAAKDPVVAGVLARIADDEVRHAELSWSALAWMLDVGGERAARTALRALARAEAEIPRAPIGDHDGESEELALGIIGAARHARVMRDAFAQIVMPIARSLVRGGPSFGAHERGVSVA
jgi:hypothetical protein